MPRAITYVGKSPGKTVRIGGQTYEFEWQKSLGVGSRKDEVKSEHAKRISKWRDRRGRKMFRIEY